MLPHNINVNAMIQQAVECCETTADHDECVAKMINLSKRGFNTMSAVFDKSSNTLTRQSWGHLDQRERINKAKEFRNIVMTHADKDTKHVMVHIKPSVDDRRRRENM